MLESGPPKFLAGGSLFEQLHAVLPATAVCLGEPARKVASKVASKHLLPRLVFSILADTEEYLHKLAAKIASVKMAAEMDKAAKAAAEDARAKVGTACHAAGRELG